MDRIVGAVGFEPTPSSNFVWKLRDVRPISWFTNRESLVLRPVGGGSGIRTHECSNAKRLGGRRYMHEQIGCYPIPLGHSGIPPII